MSAAVPVIYVLACVAVGVVVGRHRPGSPMGWLLLFLTVLLMLSLGWRVLRGVLLPARWVTRMESAGPAASLDPKSALPNESPGKWIMIGSLNADLFSPYRPNLQ
jgi:hypothetical protein